MAIEGLVFDDEESRCGGDEDRGVDLMFGCKASSVFA